MGRVVHFEIHVNDMDRAKEFYGGVFGWQFEDWSDFAGIPYFGAITGNKEEMGIDGALMQRRSQSPESGQSVNGFVCTMQVEDYNSTEAAILAHGGTISVPKHALPGMAWQGYFTDSEGNIIGIHQPDENAK